VNLNIVRSWPRGRHPALTGLALLLAPGFAPNTNAAKSRQREWRQPDSAPYLIATGPPGLRFCAPEAPPEPELRPVASGPPLPGLSAQETLVAEANSAAVQSAAEAAKKPESVIAPPGASPPPATAKPSPPAILPDDTRAQIRAEDFLPYFQVPGAPSAASPGGLPPSSATYTQSPK
jgi:hypothetical protein